METEEQIEQNITDLKEKAIEALRTLYDPEIPVNLYDLGLIYDIQITAAGEAIILMTLTSPNCPEAEGMPGAVEKRLKAVPGITDAKVIITFDPPWDMSRLSEEAKFELGFM